MTDQQRAPFDPERVITALERQLGQAAGQIARLEAVIAGLLDERNEHARATEKQQVPAGDGG